MTILLNDYLPQIEKAGSLEAIEAIRIKLLGKKGLLTAKMKSLGALAPEERKKQGQALNQIKQALLTAIEAKIKALRKAALDAQLASEWLDPSLPPRPSMKGALHPISQTIEELAQLFGEMGFQIAEGPDIEDDFHNFTALNIAKTHPARQMHDTFYLKKISDKKDEDKSEKEKKSAEKNAPYVLRTHTSPVQIRTMLSEEPPIRIIVPGRAYRSDYDMTHTPMFHQLEGLLIDKEVTMAHLKGCVISFCKRFFENENLPIRFRSSYFPFTEPSAEVDIGCYKNGTQLMLGSAPKGFKQEWLEILGCGMVNRRVLEQSNLNPDLYQGFAFGMGIERITMLKYGMPDLRSFFESDLRWLRHYGFSAFHSL